MDTVTDAFLTDDVPGLPTTVSKPAAAIHEVPLSRVKLLRIIEAMEDAVAVFDRQEQILLCNRAFEKIFTDPDSPTLIGQPLETVFAFIASDLASIIRSWMTTPGTGSEEVTFRHHHQTKFFTLTVIPIEEDGVLSEVVTVFHDITTERQTEVMRRDFVANVSHELRTPLSAINGYAETLLDGALEDKNIARDFIQVIYNHSHRLSLLVRDLLDLSKLDSSEFPAEMHPTNLMKLIEKVIQLSEKGLNKKAIRLHTALPSDLPMVLGHASSIEQVITNLLDNAIKYTPEGGAISIRATTQFPFIQVDVEDTGMGIEKKHFSRVFERFYRIDKARSRDLGGTGLGLSIVKHIIQFHGGEVWVSSTPGKGSTFSFTLKIAEAT